MNAAYERLIGVINTPFTSLSAIDTVSDELNAFILTHPADSKNQELMKLYKFVAIFI
jgi:hypothetical protein